MLCLGPPDRILACIKNAIFVYFFDNCIELRNSLFSKKTEHNNAMLCCEVKRMSFPTYPTFFCIKSHNYIRDELLELHFSYPQFLYLGIEASHISGWQDSSDFPHNVLQFQLRVHISKPTKSSVGCFRAVVLSLVILLGWEFEFLDAKSIVYLRTDLSRKPLN